MNECLKDLEQHEGDIKYWVNSDLFRLMIHGGIFGQCCRQLATRWDWAHDQGREGYL